ncbi:hypothetical protein PQR75_46825 [Paraburkholderia fungorum]|uniref:hypothetical protein n=1 Tax=Paraburkholderia fungorum TaxID=134537 RepID=UPI0038BBF8F5
MMPRWLIPVGRWKVRAEPTGAKATIGVSGRALSDSSRQGAAYHLALTPDQAQELISGLHLALLELELQRTADLARAVEGAG